MEKYLNYTDEIQKDYQSRKGILVNSYKTIAQQASLLKLMTEKNLKEEVRQEGLAKDREEIKEKAAAEKAAVASGSK